jgi:hypothetical protein
LSFVKRYVLYEHEKVTGTWMSVMPTQGNIKMHPCLMQDLNPQSVFKQIKTISTLHSRCDQHYENSLRLKGATFDFIIFILTFNHYFNVPCIISRTIWKHCSKVSYATTYDLKMEQQFRNVSSWSVVYEEKIVVCRRCYTAIHWSKLIN